MDAVSDRPGAAGAPSSRTPNLRAIPLAAWLPVIVAGGVAGTLARAALESVLPAAPGAFPWMTFAINITGSLLLGALLQTLALSGDDRGWRKAVRLGVGTGVLGGFTTYSTFAMETGRLLTGAGASPAQVGTGVAYALTSVALGVGAAVVGISASTAVVRRARAGGRS